MTRTALRITAALALIAYAAQAAPILPTVTGTDFSGMDFSPSSSASSSSASSVSSYCDPSDYACNQSVHSGNVDVGSVVNAVPVTKVTPVTKYQPIVQALAPIVDSACENVYDVYGSGGSDFGNNGMYGSNFGTGDLGGAGAGIFGSGGSDFGNNGMYGSRFAAGGNYAGADMGLHSGMLGSSLRRRHFHRRNIKSAGFEGNPTG
ncbi:hypothetical protein BGX24_011873, partial [Mortierella sp. AD032]